MKILSVQSKELYSLCIGQWTRMISNYDIYCVGRHYVGRSLTLSRARSRADAAPANVCNSVKISERHAAANTQYALHWSKLENAMRILNNGDRTVHSLLDDVLRYFQVHSYKTYRVFAYQLAGTWAAGDCDHLVQKVLSQRCSAIILK